jgi:hypothetical protein
MRKNPKLATEGAKQPKGSKDKWEKGYAGTDRTPPGTFLRCSLGCR